MLLWLMQELFLVEHLLYTSNPLRVDDWKTAFKFQDRTRDGFVGKENVESFLIDFKVFQAGASNTISESHSQCLSKTCDVSGGSQLVIWAQKKMYWADTQVQECIYQALHPEYNGCGPWGPYVRLNAPISDGHDDNLNLGCSTGDASGCN